MSTKRFADKDINAIINYGLNDTFDQLETLKVKPKQTDAVMACRTRSTRNLASLAALRIRLENA